MADPLDIFDQQREQEREERIAETVLALKRSAKPPEAAPAETMTVTVRDRSAEAPWGSGPTNPVIRTVVISVFCPVDGQRRGEPTGLNQHDDGVWYWVQVWRNPCGHTDMYEAVVKEAAALADASRTEAPGA